MPPQVVAPPVLTTVPRVELIEVGRWNISNMVGWEPTPADLANAVAALECPAVRRPVLKFGHDGTAGGDPCIGFIDNLATAEGGHLLVGDYAGIPAWLAAEDDQGRSVLASAYPDRSCEGEHGYVCQLGHTHPFVLHAMALLGVERPGVGTLQSLHDLYATAPTLEQPMPAASASRVSAEATTDDVRRAYYAGPGSDWDLWIEQLYVDPMELIVHNDEDGSLLRVPYTCAADGAVTFADPQPVKVQYVAARAAAAQPMLAFASHSEARPGTRPTSPASAPAAVPAAAGSTTTQEARSMDLLTSLRESLGLAADADEATVLAAHTAALAELEKLNDAKPEPPKQVDVPAPLSPGVVSIDESALEQLKVAASSGTEALKILRAQERDALLKAAVTDGKFAPARYEHWQKAYDVDPEGVKASIASLAKGLIPVSASGYDGGQDVETTPADDGWFPQYVTSAGQES